MNEHAQTKWHVEAVIRGKLFLDSMASNKKNVVDQISTAVHKQVVENRQKLTPIIKSILFCGLHDIAVRGKTANKGNFIELLKFRVDSGDRVLSKHFESASHKTKYVSHQIQNEIIQICG